MMQDLLEIIFVHAGGTEWARLSPLVVSVQGGIRSEEDQDELFCYFLWMC